MASAGAATGSTSARYTDTHGYVRTASTYEVTAAFAWTYRDYVVQALNEDKPYDQLPH